MLYDLEEAAVKRNRSFDSQGWSMPSTPVNAFSYHDSLCVFSFPSSDCGTLTAFSIEIPSLIFNSCLKLKIRLDQKNFVKRRMYILSWFLDILICNLESEPEHIFN